MEETLLTTPRASQAIDLWNMSLPNKIILGAWYIHRSDNDFLLHTWKSLSAFSSVSQIRQKAKMLFTSLGCFASPTLNFILNTDRRSPGNFWRWRRLCSKWWRDGWGLLGGCRGWGQGPEGRGMEAEGSQVSEVSRVGGGSSQRETCILGHLAVIAYLTELLA